MNKHLITALLSMFFLTVWMLVYKKSHDTSRKRKRITLWIGTHLPGNPKRNYYFIVLFLYLVPPILFSFLLTHFVGIKIGDMFSLEPQGGITFVYLIILSFIAGVSLTILVTNLLIHFIPGIDIPSQIGSVMWIEATMDFPRKIVWIFPFMSACCEEIFFRGACLFSFLFIGMPEMMAIILVTALFLANQLYLVETPVQAIVIGTGSFFLSVMGCMLVLLTNSIIPSMLMHAIYAAFFVNNASFADKKGYVQ